MKYLYKQTGVIVESGIVLDSAIFTPLVENEKKEMPEVAEVLKEENKPARKTTSRTAKK